MFRAVTVQGAALVAIWKLRNEIRPKRSSLSNRSINLKGLSGAEDTPQSFLPLFFFFFFSGRLSLAANHFVSQNNNCEVAKMAFGRVSVRMNDSPSASTYCIQSSSELLKSLLVHLQSCLAHTKYSHQINRNNCCLLKTLTCHSEWATFISLLFSY